MGAFLDLTQSRGCGNPRQGRLLGASPSEPQEALLDECNISMVEIFRGLREGREEARFGRSAVGDWR